MMATPIQMMVAQTLAQLRPHGHAVEGQLLNLISALTYAETMLLLRETSKDTAMMAFM